MTDNSTPAKAIQEFDLELRNGIPGLAGVTASYLFHLSGDHGGDFHLVVHDGRGGAGPGCIDDPDVRFTMDIKAGTIDDGALAFLNGEVTMEGDQALALALAPLWFDGIDVMQFVEN
jgi:SCP-2 sterol transfer family